MLMFNYITPVMLTDSTGYYAGWDDLVVGVTGFVVGITGQYVSDVMQQAMDGEFGLSMFIPSSNWQTYIGAGVGGTVGAYVLYYTLSPTLAGAATAGVTTGMGMFLEDVTGVRHYSGEEYLFNILGDAVIGGFIGRFTPKVTGFTGGANSHRAVYRAGLTRLVNKTGKMGIRPLIKGVTHGLVDGLILDQYYGVKQLWN